MFSARLVIANLMIAVLFHLSSCRHNGQPTELSGRAQKRFWPVSVLKDSELSDDHPLMPYMHAARVRELPLSFFRDLIITNSHVVVKEGSWPTYKPGVLYGGTIYMPSSSTPSKWTRHEWASFYNELFHAWYGLAFSTLEKFAQIRDAVWTSERYNHYRKAHPGNPRLAQEEAWSETVSSVMMEVVPWDYNGQRFYCEMNDLKYALDKTVAPVSHSDRPGYTPEAESTYPSEFEYRNLMFLLMAVPFT